MSTRSVVDTLRDVRKGALLDEASTELQRVVQAVRDTGKGGKITITLTVKPLDKKADVVTIEDEIVAKVPRHSKGGTIMFVTPEGNLSRRDERQGDLPLGPVAVDPPIAAYRPEVAHG